MCVFCEIANGESPARILYEDTDCLAFHDLHPQAPTHVLIIPRKHLVSVADAKESDAPVLGKLLLCAQQLAEQLGLSANGYRLVINTGAGAGQSVFHLHVHLLGGRRLRWPPG